MGGGAPRRIRPSLSPATQGTGLAATRATRQETGSSQAGVMPTPTHGYQSQPFGNEDKAAHSKKISSYSKIVDIQLS